MGCYKYETIKCPFCGELHAHITYEENRLYQLNCTECHNAIFHQDNSWDNAIKFFNGLFIVTNKWDGFEVIKPILAVDIEKTTNDRTLCCSNTCEKRFECGKSDINNVGMHYVEDYSRFGSGTCTDNGCEIEYGCGKNGNYKMFEPIKNMIVLD